LWGEGRVGGKTTARGKGAKGQGAKGQRKRGRSGGARADVQKKLDNYKVGHVADQKVRRKIDFRPVDVPHLNDMGKLVIPHIVYPRKVRDQLKMLPTLTNHQTHLRLQLRVHWNAMIEDPRDMYGWGIHYGAFLWTDDGDFLHLQSGTLVLRL
jgi:hypothetical protein